MEMLATLLCMFSMFAGIFFIIASIVRKIWKKPKKKLYSRGLLISAIVFVLSIVLFAVFETPETKAENEQRRIEAQKEKEEKEQAEKEAKEQKAKAKEEQEAKEKAEKEKKEQTEKEEAKKKEKQKDSKKEKTDSSKTTKSQDAQKEENKSSIEEDLRKAIVKVVGEENLETFNYVPDNNFALIKFKGSESLSSKMTVKGMYMDISNVLKGIQKDINVNVDINVTYPLQDSYGNISEDIVIKATFNNETIKKINFDNFDYNNIPSIADEWWNHQALNY
jgi:DNA polymerase III alpha subunit (gram-positive type)